MVRAMMNDNIDFKMTSPQETGDTASKKNSQKLLSTRTTRPDRRPDIFLKFLFASSQTLLTERVWRCKQNTSPDAHTRTFFRARVIFHSCALSMAQGEKSPRHFQCFTSISFLDVVVSCPLSSVSTCSVLTYRFTLQTFSVLVIHGKELPQKPKRIRSL